MAFYRDVDQQISQGDIFDGLPSVLLKAGEELSALRQITLPGNRVALQKFSPAVPPPTGQLDFRSGELVPAFCQVTRGILITRDCEIDKDKKHRLIAMVRPLDVLPVDDQQKIRESRVYRFFYLPADGPRNLTESYVDLRRMTSVEPGVLESGQRLVSLDEGKPALAAQLMRFLLDREMIEPAAQQATNAG